MLSGLLDLGSYRRRAMKRRGSLNIHAPPTHSANFIILNNPAAAAGRRLQLPLAPSPASPRSSLHPVNPSRDSAEITVCSLLCLHSQTPTQETRDCFHHVALTDPFFPQESIR